MAAVRAAAARASRVPAPCPDLSPPHPPGSRGPGRGDTCDTGPTAGACQWAGAGRDGPAPRGRRVRAGGGRRRGAPCPPAGRLGPSRPEQGWSGAGGALGAARELACPLRVGGCARKGSGQEAGDRPRACGACGRARVLGLGAARLSVVCSPETLREPCCSRNGKLEGGSSPGNCLFSFF